MKQSEQPIKTIFLIFLPSLALFFAMNLPDILEGIIGYSLYETMKLNEIIPVTFYLSTIFYIFSFIRRRFAKLAILPVSFALTVVPAYIYEELNPSFLISGFDIFVLLYTLTFTIISTIAVIIVKICSARKQNDSSVHTRR